MRRPLNWLVFSISLLVLVANVAASGRGWGYFTRHSRPAAVPVLGELKSDPQLSQLRTWGEIKAERQDVRLAQTSL